MGDSEANEGGHGGSGRPARDEPALTSAERRDAERLRAYRRKRRLVRIGQVLMAIGVVIGVVHWLAHIGTFGGQPSGLTDLLAGYPAAAVVFVVGAILAGQ